MYLGVKEATYYNDHKICAGYVALFKMDGDFIGVGDDYLKRALSNTHASERLFLTAAGISEQEIRKASSEFSNKIINSGYDFRPEQFPESTVEEFNALGLAAITPTETGYKAIQVFGTATNSRVLKTDVLHEGQDHGFTQFFPN